MAKNRDWCTTFASYSAWLKERITVCTWVTLALETHVNILCFDKWLCLQSLPYQHQVNRYTYLSKTSRFCPSAKTMLLRTAEVVSCPVFGKWTFNRSRILLFFKYMYTIQRFNANPQFCNFRQKAKPALLWFYRGTVNVTRYFYT